MLIKGQDSLANAGLLPTITNLTLESGRTSVFSLVLQTDSVIDRKRKSWILDEEVQNLLRLKLVFCFSREKALALKANKLTLAEEKNSTDAFVIDEPLRLDGNSVVTQTEKTKHLSDTITKKIEIFKTDIEYLCIFISIYIDNEAVASKLKVSPSIIKNLLSTSSFEEFIIDGKSVNKKFQKLDILTTINSENLVFDVLNFETQISKLSSLRAVYETNDPTFSPLSFTRNSTDRMSFFFFVDLKAIIRQKSIFSSLFNNEQFFQSYIQNTQNNKPTFISIVRIGENTKTLIQTLYGEKIENENVYVEEIKVSNGQLCLSFTDKVAELHEKYTYKITLEFNDNTIQYTEILREKLQNNANVISQIINIARLGNYYNNSMNRLDARFWDALVRQRLSLNSVTQDFIGIAKQLSDVNNLNELYSMVTSKNVSIQMLELLLSVNNFLLLELTRLQNNALKTSESKWQITKHFADVIDYGQISLSKTDVLTYSGKGLLKISLAQLNQRISSEISKYYNSSNVQIENKYGFLSPQKISSREVDLNTLSHKLSEMNYDLYNQFFIDLMYSKYNEQLKLTDIEKIQEILKTHGITIDQTTAQMNVSQSKFSNPQNIIQSFNQLLLKEEELSIFLKILLSFVIKDDLEFIQKLDIKSTQSQISSGLLATLPYQLKYVYDALQENQFANLILDQDNVFDFKKWIAFFINLRTLYRIEYLDSNNFIELKWKPLQSLPAKSMICRFVPYYNEKLNINENLTLNFELYNQYFILTR